MVAKVKIGVILLNK